MGTKIELSEELKIISARARAALERLERADEKNAGELIADMGEHCRRASKLAEGLRKTE